MGYTWAVWVPGRPVWGGFRQGWFLGFTVCGTTHWHMVMTALAPGEGCQPVPGLCFPPFTLAWTWMCTCGNTSWDTCHWASPLDTGAAEGCFLCCPPPGVGEKAIWGSWPSLGFKFTPLPMQLGFISSAKDLNLSTKCLSPGLGMHAGIVTEKPPGRFS